MFPVYYRTHRTLEAHAIVVTVLLERRQAHRISLPQTPMTDTDEVGSTVGLSDRMSVALNTQLGFLAGKPVPPHASPKD